MGGIGRLYEDLPRQGRQRHPEYSGPIPASGGPFYRSTILEPFPVDRWRELHHLWHSRSRDIDISHIGMADLGDKKTNPPGIVWESDGLLCAKLLQALRVRESQPHQVDHGYAPQAALAAVPLAESLDAVRPASLSGKQHGNRMPAV